MNGTPDKSGNVFLDTLKWYAAGCAVTFAAFYAMRYSGLEMRSIAFCFQVSAGIFLGGLLQARARREAGR